MRPLEGILVLDFSQYLSGPSCALRLADLGARVIEVENPKMGDNSRRLCVKSMVYDGDSVNFQAINRDKESFAANLKDPRDMKMVKRLIKEADVLVENFRPGVMKKLGLDYECVKAFNPRLVYATITGYGSEGPWVKKPGQDLLVQSMSGLAYMNGNGDQPLRPLPFQLRTPLPALMQRKESWPVSSAETRLDWGATWKYLCWNPFCISNWKVLQHT